MLYQLKFRVFICCIVAGAAAVGFFVPAGRAGLAEEPLPNRSIYQTDPDHLWNRLHEALFVRVGPDGRAYGRDRLDPLLFPQTKHLLEDRSRDRAIALLERFVKEKGEALIDDPLKRAVLQRDLWLVFNWLDRRGAQTPLRRPLAAVIGRLALSPDQIKKLPDNYAAAVASGRFPKRYDRDRPERPYLPPDLFAADGPWVCLGRPDGLVAPEHVDEGPAGTAFTNSAFLVFLRLPAGRAATLAYLKSLRDFDQPWLVKADAGVRGKYLPNPKLPQFPVGTEVALVRRALLIAAPHTPMPTALTESVQLRVYREIPDMTAQTLDVTLREGTAANRRAQEWQSSHEFRLSRSMLFAGRAGGLRAVGPDERDFRTGFRSHSLDPFEIRTSDQSFPGVSYALVKETCFKCHRLPGVYSFNSFLEFRTRSLEVGDDRRPAALAEVSLSDALGSAVKWKEARPSWTALRELLATAAEDKGKDKPATPAEQYKALHKEYEVATKAFSKAYAEAKTDEERKKVAAEKSPYDKFAPRFLELAQKSPKDPVAVDALVWVLDNSGTLWGKDSPQANAIALLLRDHIRSDKLARVCRRMRSGYAKESETFLRTVLEKNPHKDVQGQACLALGQFLNNRLQMLDLVQDSPDSAKQYEGLLGKDYFEELRRQDRAKVAAEAESLFQRAADKYGDVNTVGAEAKSELFEIRHLAVGKKAPEIEGEDQDGKPFKLSDYRGKVVLLDFWSLY